MYSSVVKYCFVIDMNILYVEVVVYNKCINLNVK